MTRRFLILLTALLVTTQLPAVTHPKLVTPSNGKVLSTNMPILSWTPVSCDRYEVFINDRLMATLPSADHSTVPFALSFGTHRWKVVAVTGDKRIQSETFTFTVDDLPLSEVPSTATLLRYNWRVAPVSEISVSGMELTTTDFTGKEWQPTTLPATVLTAYVRNGVYPNPVIGMNNMLIPDMNDDYNRENGLLKYSHLPGKNPWNRPYWYVTSFDWSGGQTGKRFWLNLGEINYKAGIWLNGTQIAGPEELIGMERTFRIEVTALLKPGEKNRMAIMIWPPDQPGKPAPDPVTPLADPGTNMADGMISKNYTKWDVLGWDWQPPVRDRDMGITEDVWIDSSDDLLLEDLYVTSQLFLPDTNRADLMVSARLVNAGKTALAGNVNLTVTGPGLALMVSAPYSVSPGESKTVEFFPSDFPTLKLKGIRLWWPAGYGGQPLYHVSLDARTTTGDQATVSHRYGFRQVETFIGKKERVFRINGRDIYLKGGNWVIDMMLNWTASRYRHEIELTKHANLNILRVWGPTGVAPKPFYQAADEMGILLWQDFLNDFWGTFKNTPGYQPDESLFKTATTGIVRKYRNHPSLIMWCGGNEGPNPREDLIVNTILKQEDSRSGRFYLKQSDGDGLHGGGPYHTMEPWQYFIHPKLNGFSSEIGPSGLPEVEQVRRFMPERGQNWLPGRFPLDGTWAFHDANDWPGEDTRKFTAYDNQLRHYYGSPDTSNAEAGFADYIRKAQIINYDVYRASIESINRQLWSNSSGILLWKSNSSWPSLAWQIYDWYLHAHAGFYATRLAAGMQHIQLNRDDRSVSWLNGSGLPANPVEITATGYSKDAKPVWNKQVSVRVNSNGVTLTGITIPEQQEITWLKLTGTGENKLVLAQNFYWLDPKNDFRFLAVLPEPTISMNVAKTRTADENHYQVTLTNTGKTVAFMARLQVVSAESDVEFTPVFWSDNYLCLLPGESKTVTARIYHADQTADARIRLTMVGTNRVWY